MKYILLDYVGESGWPALTRAEQEHWLGAYRAYMQAMTQAGVLKTSGGLYPTSSATTVRISHDKPQVLDGPYTDTKEQLGGFHTSKYLIWMPRSLGQRGLPLHFMGLSRCVQYARGHC